MYYTSIMVIWHMMPFNFTLVVEGLGPMFELRVGVTSFGRPVMMLSRGGGIS